MTDPTQTPAPASAAEVLEMVARYVEAERVHDAATRRMDAEQQARVDAGEPLTRETFAWTPEYRAALDALHQAHGPLLALNPADLRALAGKPAPVEEISVEEFVRRESPNWAHVENAVEYVRTLRGDAQPAPSLSESGEGLLSDYQAQQEARRREVQSLSPGLRRDLERLCVVASGPETHGGITESRGREILACSVTEFRALILEHDPPEAAQPAPAPAPADALREAVERLLQTWQERFDQQWPKQGEANYRARASTANAVAQCRNDLSRLLAQHPTTPPAGAGAEAWKEVAVTRLRPGDRVRSGRTVVTVARVGEGAYPDEWNVGWAENIPNTRYRRDARVFAAQAQAEGGSDA